MTSKSKKKELKRQWPRDMYLEEDAARHDREYREFRDTYEQDLSAQGFNIFDRLAPNSGYKPVSESPQFLNISAPPAPFMIRHARRDPYEKSKARFESKPKLSAIPERGARGIAAAGRYPGTLTASEIAEVDSHLGHARITTDRGNGVANGSSRGIPMSDAKDDSRSYVSGFDAPPSYKSADSNNNWWRRKNMSPPKMKICIGIIVALVLVGIVISVVAIYFSLIAMNDSDNSDIVRYEFTMRLGKVNFSATLLNNKSSKYLNLQKDICDTMRLIIDDITLCELDACRQGSIITDFTLGVPKKISDEYKQSNSGKYSDSVITTIKQAWRKANSPASVKSFVDNYGPEPQSLILREDLPATSTTTTSTPASTVSHTDTTTIAATTPQHVPQTTIPSTTSSPTSSEEIDSTTQSLTTQSATLSTTSTVATTAVQSTQASTHIPTSVATSTGALSVEPTRTSALTSTDATTSGTPAPTMDPTSHTSAPTSDPTASITSSGTTTAELASHITVIMTT